MDFFTMGMFCVDEVHAINHSYTDIIGGAGTYAALGAGVVVPKSNRERIGFICDEGSDFSDSMHKEIANWGTGVIFRKDLSRQTTKAWNKFVNNEERLFKYLSPKRQIVYEDLPPDARRAKVIHLICSPQRCAEFMTKFRQNETTYQKYVWEPVPTECRPERYPELKSVVTEFKVDVLSPNALEAASFVSLPEPLTKHEVEKLDQLHYQFAPIIAIRCGSMGCYLRVQSTIKWYPAYFDSQNAERVVDPSGAGNAFTGALGEAIAQNLDWDTAMAYAAVGASFMIEQVGAPSYNSTLDTWNDSLSSSRIKEYLNRIAA